MILKRIHDYFIPAEIRKNVVVNTQAKIFVNSALLISLVFFANAYRGFASNDAVKGFSIIIATGLLISTFWILKATGSNKLAGNVFTAIFFIALFVIIYRSAGPSSMTHLFFAILIILSFLICGFASGIVWGILSLLQLISFQWMAKVGIQFFPFRTDVYFVSVLILLSMVLMLAAVYEKSSKNNLESFAMLKEKSEQTAEELGQLFDEVDNVMACVAEGNLTQKISFDATGNLATLKKSINSALGMLSHTIADVMTVTQTINSGTIQVSQAAQSLANGASKQAASLEQISSSMEDIGAKARSNSENAHLAQGLSQQTSVKINDVNTQMETMLDSIKRINETSSGVSKVIKVIEEIAFQTNLLALNAAVEAARAGKYGKGFAVVAEEVRSLSGRSSKATQDTTQLIKNSQKEVENGVSTTDTTVSTLKSFVESTQKITDLIEEISQASQEQAIAANEISKSLSLVNEVVQRNSSISEETASASEELRAQTDTLHELMSHFHL